MTTAVLEAPTAARPASDPDSVREPPPKRGTSARTLFRVSFSSEMTGEDAERLARALDMALSLHAKHPAVAAPLGVMRLDSSSGLFLVRGDGDAAWAIECRTWGEPAAETVRGWLFTTILAVRGLDGSVAFPVSTRTPEAVVPASIPIPSTLLPTARPAFDPGPVRIDQVTVRPLGNRLSVDVRFEGHRPPGWRRRFAQLVSQRVYETPGWELRSATGDPEPPLVVSDDLYDEQLVHIRAKLAPADVRRLVAEVVHATVRQLAAT